MIAAAFLRDVLEDVAPFRTEFRRPVMLAEFGADVVDLVDWCTKPRGATAADVLDLLGRAPARAQTIKTADIIENTSTLMALDPRRAVTYFPKKLAQVEVMTLADRRLRRMALDILAECTGISGAAAARAAKAAIREAAQSEPPDVRDIMLGAAARIEADVA